jgi:hypothetical protein
MKSGDYIYRLKGISLVEGPPVIYLNAAHFVRLLDIYSLIPIYGPRASLVPAAWGPREGGDTG